MTNKKKFIIVGMTVVVLAIVGIAIGVNNHRNAVAAQKKADEKARVVRLEKSISRKTTAIRNEESHDKALADLKNLESDYRNYKKTAKPEAKVLALYKSDIAKMKGSFKSKDAKKLNAVTLDDKALAKTAKKDIQNNLKALSDLSDTVKGEGSIVYNTKETKALTAKFDKLTDSYSAQIKRIDDSAKKAKEEAAKKNAEAAANVAVTKDLKTSTISTDVPSTSFNSSASTSSTASTSAHSTNSVSSRGSGSAGTTSSSHVQQTSGSAKSSSSKTVDNSSKGVTYRYYRDGKYVSTNHDWTDKDGYTHYETKTDDGKSNDMVVKW